MPTLLVCTSPTPTGLGINKDKGCTAACVVPRPKTELLMPNVVPGAKPRRPVETLFPFVPAGGTPMEFVRLALTMALAVPDAAAWAYGAEVEPCRGPDKVVLDVTMPERPEIWPTALVVGTPLLASPRLRAWLRLETGLGVRGDWTWLMTVPTLEGDVVDAGLGKRIPEGAAEGD